MMSKQLHVLEVPNVKKLVVAGLQKKVDELGNLAVPFKITTEYPSMETFDNTAEGNPVTFKNVRRMVVKRVTESVKQYAIGDVVQGETILPWQVDPQAEIYESEEILMQGWIEDTVIEVSIWCLDANDRDNIMELIKLWMLELQHDINQGNIDVRLPYFFDRNLFAVRYLRSYEDKNENLKAPSGVVYIGSVLFEITSPFAHVTEGELLEQYRAYLTSQVVDCISIED